MAYHLIFMFMLMFFPATPNAQKPPASATLTIGGYRMVLFWPPGVCHIADSLCDKGKLSDAFTAHGLWPFDQNVKSVISNGAKSFAGVKSGLEKELKLYWKTYYVYTPGVYGYDEDLWGHEWDKHGVLGGFSQPDDYFKAGLQLTKKYGKLLVHALEKDGIMPTDTYGKTYEVSEIRLAIFKTLKMWPEVVCKEGNTSGVFVLYEVRLLFNTNLGKRINPKSSNCMENQHIYFLSTESFLPRHTEEF